MPDTFTPEQISQILEEFFKVVGTRQYIGARYVPIFGRKDEESIEWDNTGEYEPLTIVLYQGNSYTSRQFVPIGVEITNQKFWAITGNYNAQVEMYRRETAAAREVADNALAAANDAQDDIDTLLPKADFSAENTVKKYVDDSVAEVQSDIDTLLPKSAFSDQLTVKDYADEIKSKAIIHFATVADMKSYDISAGSVCKTLGFYSANDNGGATYQVVESATPNDMDVIELSNGLFAMLCVNEVVSIAQLGCQSADTNATAYLNRAFELCKTVYIPSGSYSVVNVSVPDGSTLYGASDYFRQIQNSGGTYINQSTAYPCFVIGNNCKLHDFKFISTATEIVTRDTVSLNCDYAIKCNGGVDTEIYNITFLGVNKGIGYDRVETDIGFYNIHDIYGCVYTTAIHLYGSTDFGHVENVALVPQAYLNPGNVSKEFDYIRRHMTVLDLGRQDYATFNSIKAFLARYGVSFHNEDIVSQHRGAHNCLFSQLEMDSVGTSIYAPESTYASANECSFVNCTFTDGVQTTNESLTYDDHKLYGIAPIEINDNSMLIVSDCLFTGLEYHVAIASNKAKIHISNCMIKSYDNVNPEDFVPAFIGSENPTIVVENCHFYEISAKHATGLVSSDNTGLIRFVNNVFDKLAVVKSDEYVKDNIYYSGNMFGSLLNTYAGNENTGFDSFMQNWNLPDIRLNDKNFVIGSITTANVEQTKYVNSAFIKKCSNVILTVTRWGEYVSKVINPKELSTAGNLLYQSSFGVDDLSNLQNTWNTLVKCTNDSIAFVSNGGVFLKIRLMCI